MSAREQSYGLTALVPLHQGVSGISGVLAFLLCIVLGAVALVALATRHPRQVNLAGQDTDRR